MYLHLNDLVQCTYCVHVCFYIVLICLKIPACNYICNEFCSYIYNYTVDHHLHLNPLLNLPIPPNLSLTLPVSHLDSSKIWTRSTLYLFFDVSIAVKAT